MAWLLFSVEQKKLRGSITLSIRRFQDSVIAAVTESANPNALQV
jgi:hypothetical protein